jgi:hypothetical protein
MFAQYFNVTLYTSDSQITVSDTVNEFPFSAASMDSSGSRIVNVAISVTNPITYFFDAGGAGQPGSFLPSGSGSGISGAGYLTDGQQTDPFFGFLKPKAYVNGGFGNSYEYGQPGVPKEGGFGGGQSPLNKKTSLTSVTGYKQVRPSIPVNDVRQMNSIALSEDGNTFFASGQKRSGTPLNFTNVYTYIDSSWTNTNISDEWSYVSTSADGSVWLINGDVWRNGSFETTLDTVGSYYMIPGLARSSISSDGNTVVVLSVNYTYPGVQYTLNVFTYSGTWNSTSLPLSSEVPNDIYAAQCVISGDGSTIVLNVSEAIPTVFTFVDVYTKAGETWSSPNRIYTNTSITSGTLGINSNGSEIVFARSKNYSLYSNGNITTFPSIENISFSRTNPDFYVYSIGNKIYAPSISLDVTININDKNSYIASGSNIVATTDSSSPQAFVFLDMYNPTTTCTAATSVDHGYPRKYEVQITGTQYFNGTWLIKPTSSNTFTFQAFGGPTVTSGYVSGTTTGISGGGGYTGSAGDGVSGATCYADESVANFTDLGAKSNTAGTVTISLIDPIPLKQKWTWDQTLTTTAPKTAFQVVNWSDKLGKFQSVTGSSTDGIHWDGFTIFEVLATGASSEFPFYTAYSDTLNLYIGMKTGLGFNFIYIISNDGIVWTEPVTEGLNVEQTNVMYNSSPFVWAPELGLFVYVSNTIISTSYDGIIWTERYYDPTFNGAKSIAYSPSIHTFVCTASWSSSSDTGVYSTDGLTWNTWMVVTYPVIEGQTVIASGDSVTWSPKLNIFVASVTYTFLTENQLYSNAYIARSTDGQTWTTDGFNIPNDPGIYGWQILWSEELNIFSAISTYSNQNTTIHSYDGINWSFITTSGITGQLAYSPSLQLFLVSDEIGLRQFISIEGIYYVDIAGYYPPVSRPYCTWGSQVGKFIKQNVEAGSVSSDGIHWEQSSITKDDTPAWSPELGLFVALTFDSPIVDTGLAYYSYDGKTWTETSFNVPSFPPPPPSIDPFLTLGRLPYVAWSPTLGAFSGAFYSRDGINWSPSLVGCTAVGWSSFHGMFVAFYYTYVYYSYDGTTWSTGNNTTEFNGNGIIACSSFGRFVCEASTNFQEEFTPQGVLYSDDGINWISPGVAFPFSGPIWAEELSVFVASSYNTYTGSDNDTGWVSSDGISWSQLDFQIGSWSPELGLFLCPGGYSPVSKTF